MKLHIQHTFNCTPTRFWEMYWDDDLDAMLNEGSNIQRDLLEERTEGDVLIRRVRFTPERELPAAAAKLLGTNKLVYEQENAWDRSNSVLHWKVIPTILPGKLDAQGTFAVSPLGDAQCEQLVQGVISVNVRFIGGQIEKAVIAEVERSWNRTAETCRTWLQRHGA
ncbi:MAG TPA: DUF2505 domain-containing protein [Deltaproteobacteria bacterium]|nr:DUF2505 domain-containing protein [Deltaproteobacteria bacterium]